ncbi:hypothetical protein GF322_03240 [Candidatus Dependentiae bacterium]|nr:hypothetical protein [Candidatus Dependentiae bacterium]
MKIIKNIFYILILIGVTFLACNAFTSTIPTKNSSNIKKLAPEEEIKLLQNLVKEKTEAAQAELEYWQKMSLAGGLVNKEIDELKEETISRPAHEGLKKLKDPIFNFLASSEDIKIGRLKKRYEKAKNALIEYGEKYLGVETLQDVSATEKGEPIIPTAQKKDSIEIGMPPTPDLPPLIEPQEKDEIKSVPAEKMKVKPEMFKKAPTPPQLPKETQAPPISMPGAKPISPPEMGTMVPAPEMQSMPTPEEISQMSGMGITPTPTMQQSPPTGGMQPPTIIEEEEEEETEEEVTPAMQPIPPPPGMQVQAPAIIEEEEEETETEEEVTPAMQPIPPPPGMQ